MLDEFFIEGQNVLLEDKGIKEIIDGEYTIFIIENVGLQNEFNHVTSSSHLRKVIEEPRLRGRAPKNAPFNFRRLGQYFILLTIYFLLNCSLIFG